MIGLALFAQQAYPKAEQFLLQGYQDLEKQLSKKPSTSGAKLLRETVGRLIELYNATDRAEKAAPWREKLR